MIYIDKSNVSTDKRPTHKIEVAKSPDDEQSIAFYAYSAEEMKSVTVGISIVAELYGLDIFQRIYEADPAC